MVSLWNVTVAMAAETSDNHKSDSWGLETSRVFLYDSYPLNKYTGPVLLDSFFIDGFQSRLNAPLHKV